MGIQQRLRIILAFCFDMIGYLIMGCGMGIAFTLGFVSGMIFKFGDWLKGEKVHS